MIQPAVITVDGLRCISGSIGPKSEDDVLVVVSVGFTSLIFNVNLI